MTDRERLLFNLVSMGEKLRENRNLRSDVDLKVIRNN